ncbi:lactonase family protein [Paenibacillus sp. sgz302251]|uniref:lactonase family protein n=1 Tax=Paenibacillus sp. sgz302251 TaxID=3414493 RepID=UPI003C7A34CE
MTVDQQRLLVFAGSYAEPEDSGVYVYAFDEDKGILSLTDEYAGLKNPTFLNVDADRGILYSIGETVNSEGHKVGEAAVFAIDSAKGTISLIQRELTVDSTTCHIQRDANSRYLTVTSYHGGMIGLLSLLEDGKIGKVLDIQQHVKSSEHRDRPHPHSSFFSPDERFLLISDLGLDRIVTYSIDKANNKLMRHGEIALHSGAGPRHLTFHPNGKFVYAINELDSTITAFDYDAETGLLAIKETVSTLPADFNGDNGCAEIAISADGKYVYGSNRGHDSIVVFAVEEQSGLLSIVQHISVQGGHPRHFALTPSGRYLLAANRDTNNIVIFNVNQENGKLNNSGNSVTVSKPVCVIPVYLTT